MAGGSLDAGVCVALFHQIPILMPLFGEASVWPLMMVETPQKEQTLTSLLEKDAGESDIERNLITVAINLPCY